tara:strand:- start:385 stop:831 length:447 start_codon:yes stop_codon:yes gene_type:complete
MPIFRAIGLGTNIKTALEYASIDIMDISPDLSEALDKKIPVRLHNDYEFNTSKIELNIWISRYLETSFRHKGDYSSSERASIKFMDDYYPRPNNIYSVYESNDKCLAIPLSYDEIETWKSQHKGKYRNTMKLYKFIGNADYDPTPFDD